MGKLSLQYFDVGIRNGRVL